MQAIILAAGHGSRLWPLSEARPKVMMPIGNKPILEHIIKALVDNGVTDIAIVVGYRRGIIQAHFGDGSDFGASITYIEQMRLLGTAHAVTMAKDFPKGDFLLLPGDNVISSQVIKELIAGGVPNTALLTRSMTPSKYGVVELDDGMVTGITEKPAVAETCLISTGIFLFNKDVMLLLEQAVEAGMMGLSEALRPLLKTIKLKGVITSGTWCDAVYPWDAIDMNSRFITSSGQNIAGRIEPGVLIKGPVSIGEGTRIRSGCHIEGPVIIGKGCDIGPSVTIFPVTSIGDNVTISPFTFISGSLIMSGTSISSHCHVGRSLIDANVRIGPNTCLSSSSCLGRVRDELIPLKDIGSVIGSNTVIGACVSIQSGTVVGNGCHINDGARLRQNINDRSEVY